MAQATVRATSFGVNTGDTSVVVTPPSSVAVGDWILVQVMTSAAAVTAATPSGWTLLADSGAVNTRHLQTFGKRRASGDGSTYAFTLSAASGASWGCIVGAGGTVEPSTWIHRTYPSADTGVTRGYDIRYTYYQETGATTVTRIRGLDVPADALVLTLAGEASGSTETESQITVTGATKLAWYGATSGVINTQWIGADRAAGGTTPTVLITYPNVQNSNGAGTQIAIPTLTETTTPVTVTRLAGRMADGQGGIVDVGLVGWDGSKEVGLSKIEYVHPSPTVSEILAMKRVFTMAHRLGSRDYQEHTLRGATESLICHADILEFSIARTSDGVWFGLHDDTLNRTSSSLGSAATNPYRPAEHTWAEISALVQDLPSRGDTRFTTAPYMTLDELVAAYPNATFMLDPKVIGSAAIPALIAKVQTFPNYRERFFGKYFHTAVWLADMFAAAGIKTWGYAYTEAITGIRTDGTPTNDPLLSETARRWTMIGMEYSATAEVWARVMEIAAVRGQKVIGHICPTAETAQRAVGFGAHGIQASGIRSVSTVY